MVISCHIVGYRLTFWLQLQLLLFQLFSLQCLLNLGTSYFSTSSQLLLTFAFHLSALFI